MQTLVDAIVLIDEKSFHTKRKVSLFIYLTEDLSKPSRLTQSYMALRPQIRETVIFRWLYLYFWAAGSALGQGWGCKGRG